MQKNIAVILMSGGMDSAVCAALAIKDGYEPAGLHLNYGQKTQAKELEQFERQCAFYGIGKKLVVDVSHLRLIGGSSLTDDSMEVGKADLQSTVIPSSYVPFRNANILAIAVSWAEVLGAGRLYIGAVEEDSSGYPDTRREFFEAFEAMIDKGTKPETRIKIETPIIDMSKAEIVRLGSSLGVPFEMTWSCYKSSDKACGECDSCALRLRGFERAGITDPIPYED